MCSGLDLLNSMIKSRFKTSLGLSLIILATTIIAAAADTTNRPANWAQKIVLPGVPNCYQVTTSLFRGAQPTSEGMKQLRALGVKTVVNLRAFHSDTDKVAGTGLKSVRFEAKPWHAE